MNEDIQAGQASRHTITCWKIVSNVCAILIVGSIILLGEDAPFLLLHPLTWIILSLSITSPFFVREALAEQQGKNKAWLRLIPGTIFTGAAGRFFGMMLIDYPLFFLTILYVGLPLAIAYLLVRKPILEGKLSWKLVASVYIAAFILGYFSIPPLWIM